MRRARGPAPRTGRQRPAGGRRGAGVRALRFDAWLPSRLLARCWGTPGERSTALDTAGAPPEPPGNAARRRPPRRRPPGHRTPDPEEKPAVGHAPQDDPTLRHRRARAESWRVLGLRTCGIAGPHAAPAGRQDGGAPSTRGRAVTRSQRGMPCTRPRDPEEKPAQRSGARAVPAGFGIRLPHVLLPRVRAPNQSRRGRAGPPAIRRPSARRSHRVEPDPASTCRIHATCSPPWPRRTPWPTTRPRWGRPTRAKRWPRTWPRRESGSIPTGSSSRRARARRTACCSSCSATRATSCSSRSRAIPSSSISPVWTGWRRGPTAWSTTARWEIDLDHLARMVNARTRAVLLVNPNNPHRLVRAAGRIGRGPRGRGAARARDRLRRGVRRLPDGGRGAPAVRRPGRRHRGADLTLGGDSPNRRGCRSSSWVGCCWAGRTRWSPAPGIGSS